MPRDNSVSSWSRRLARKDAGERPTSYCSSAANSTTRRMGFLKRPPRRLHSEGSEFVFLSLEGKPMTDSWWPKRGAACRPVDDESKGHLVQSSFQSRDTTTEVLHDPPYIHRVGAFEGGKPKRACRILRNLGPDVEQSYGRFRRDFLGPLVAARPRDLRGGCVRGKTGPLTAPARRYSEKRP